MSCKSPPFPLLSSTRIQSRTPRTESFRSPYPGHRSPYRTESFRSPYPFTTRILGRCSRAQRPSTAMIVSIRRSWSSRAHIGGLCLGVGRGALCKGGDHMTLSSTWTARFCHPLTGGLSRPHSASSTIRRRTRCGLGRLPSIARRFSASLTVGRDGQSGRCPYLALLSI